VNEPGALFEGRSRETRIRRDARGRWFDGEQPIEHELLTRAFDRWIDKAEDGRYRLVNDINWAYIEVEGAPLFVRHVELGETGVTLVLSDETSELLNPNTLREDEEGALYAQARGGRLPARFDSHAALGLAPILVDDRPRPTLLLAGRRYEVPVVANPLEWPSG
jgi:uncharacterized protein